MHPGRASEPGTFVSQSVTRSSLIRAERCGALCSCQAMTYLAEGLSIEEVPKARP